ncbi:MAG: ParB/RepB/Spo0J family partition protein [Sphingomonadaceae bacterium]|uniref:ParB/RepB/Spo0J family partition protein n=1 Tax=Thermaurantiacus sp. TaxID=2820283 RepID=UPI00298F14F9|nr:ParB/RepB/Spo0J family partition protein [Thermaurantiacus sp.]MCS6987676.1 ParB/RepB/Spo0J family partition protein [Sphingomonadaceae bacterium]MDW8415277.1 ParB/RepB/Spo0J family partition protein [Thermaurantiacus sp.]
MAKPSRGLGKGLQALLDEMGAPRPADAPTRIPIDLIEPNPAQPRRRFDEAALAELAASIRAQGILQPLLLRPLAQGRYQIVAGERRWRAAQRAGLAEVPAVVRDLDDGQVLQVALIENLQRADLDPIEEAEAYRRLADEFGHTQERIAELTGKSRPHVANMLRLLALPKGVRALLAEGALSVGHGKLLASAPDPEGLARRVVAAGLTVRQLEALLRRQSRGAAREPMRPDPDREALEAQLSEALGCPVSIRMRGAGGDLVIRFANLDQLDALLAKLQS